MSHTRARVEKKNPEHLAEGESSKDAGWGVRGEKAAGFPEKVNKSFRSYLETVLL